jgi:flagellar motor protein MotB
MNKNKTRKKERKQRRWRGAEANESTYADWMGLWACLFQPEWYLPQVTPHVNTPSTGRSVEMRAYMLLLQPSGLQQEKTAKSKVKERGGEKGQKKRKGIR